MKDMIDLKQVIKYWQNPQPYYYWSKPTMRFSIEAVARNESGEYVLALDISKCECWRLTDWWGCLDCVDQHRSVSYHDSPRECKKRAREILESEIKEINRRG